MTQAPPIPIAADTHCTNCGYNLRGLKPTDQCPECSQAVSQS